MRILTETNTVFDLNNLSEHDNDVRFGVLDYSDQSNIDYFFMPLVFLESFSTAAIDIQIGKYRIQMPWDWNIIIGDKEVGDLEIAKIEFCMDKDFSAFTYNPLTGFKPDFMHIDIIGIYPDVTWYFPKMKPGQILSIPLSDGPNPYCVYMVKELAKIPEVLNINEMI